MNYFEQYFRVTILLVVLALIGGCASPLKSDNHETRMSAVSDISDEKELFLVAMNVGVEMGFTHGSYTDLWLTEENYCEDVRVAAVGRLKDASSLLKCATWRDGETYVDPGREQGRMEYKGETYYVRESDRRLHQKVKPGDAVRAAALSRLKAKDVFEEVCSCLCAAGGTGRTVGVRNLFPANVYWTGSYWANGETSFVDGYGAVRKGNPLDTVLSDIVKCQDNQESLCCFVSTVRGDGAKIYPNALFVAIDHIDGTSQDACSRLLGELLEGSGKGYSLVPTIYLWRIFEKIEKHSPNQANTLAKVGYGDVGKDDVATRDQINAIAEHSFTDEDWATSYLEESFKDYASNKKIENIKGTNALARVLVAARKMNAKDADAAISRINDPRVLQKVNEDCYLKVVAESSSQRLFNLTYTNRLAEISQMTDKVPRAIAASDFANRLKNSDVDSARKAKIGELLKKWMSVGAEVLVAEAEQKSEQTFALGGFYVGMRGEAARLLYDVKYPDEEITWSVGSDGAVERLNFGTTYLAKVFSTDAQTWKEWIDSFSKKTGRRFVADELKDSKKPIGGRGTVVKVSQPIWRSQDNRANITLTYFGDKTVEELEPEAAGFVESVFKLARGVTGGDVLKEVVLEGARHWANKGWEAGVGGYPGMLRVERGTVGPGGTRQIKRTGAKSDLDRTADSIKDTWDAMKDAAPVVEGVLNKMLN